jgi:hypothetical protein
MVSGTLVEARFESGRRLLDDLEKAGFVVRAACWVKPSEEDDRWWLYIASPDVNQKGALEGYRAIDRVYRLSKPDFSPDDIKLIDETDPIVEDALKLLQRCRNVWHFHEVHLGDRTVAEVYVYRIGPHKPVEVPIYGLVFDGEPGGALHLSFEKHHPDSTLTVDNRNVYPARTGIDWVVAAPEDAKLERNGNGQRELVWKMYGNPVRSSANEIWSLAHLRLHGFRFLREPA